MENSRSIWRAIGAHIFEKFGSKKFFAAIGAFTIIMMHASGMDIDPDILKMAGATLLGYPLVEGVVDIVRTPKDVS